MNKKMFRKIYESKSKWDIFLITDSEYHIQNNGVIMKLLIKSPKFNWFQKIVCKLKCLFGWHTFIFAGGSYLYGDSNSPLFFYAWCEPCNTLLKFKVGVCTDLSFNSKEFKCQIQSYLNSIKKEK